MRCLEWHVSRHPQFRVQTRSARIRELYEAPPPANADADAMLARSQDDRPYHSAREEFDRGRPMYEQDRYANDITCFVDIQLMLVCEFYLVAFIGFELGKENLHRTDLTLAKRACTLFYKSAFSCIRPVSCETLARCSTAAMTLTLVLAKQFLSQANILWSHLNQFVVGNEFHSLLERMCSWRR